jgi:hypothetical protein
MTMTSRPRSPLRLRPPLQAPRRVSLGPEKVSFFGFSPHPPVVPPGGTKHYLDHYDDDDESVLECKGLIHKWSP